MYTSENVAKLEREAEEFVSKMSDNKFFKQMKPQKPKAVARQHVIKHPVFSILYRMTHEDQFSFKDAGLVDEMSFRIKFVEEMKADPGWAKANKFKIAQIESEAMDSADIPMLGAFFRAVCARRNLSVMVIKGNIYKTSDCDCEQPTHVIECDTAGSRFVLVTDVDAKAKHARDNFFEFSKPLRAISAYKVDELREIARRVGIADKGLLKKQIYEKILSCLTF
jgi:hypothetical protein